jgi:pyruvate dehydrogenase E2 component (dihydrolipoamide acetyltransferase)
MKEIKFVDVGEGITEGHLQKWLVSDGAQVKEDQPIVQVETDKAIVSVPAPSDGILKIVAMEDTTLHVGDTLAYIGTPQELSGIAQMPTAAQEYLKSIQAGVKITEPARVSAVTPIKEILARR